MSCRNYFLHVTQLCADAVRVTLMARKAAPVAEVVDEVVEQFTTKVGSQVTITVEVQAQSAAGFDENVQRAVRENCKTLKFSSFDFEVED